MFLFIPRPAERLQSSAWIDMIDWRDLLFVFATHDLDNLLPASLANGTVNIILFVFSIHVSSPTRSDSLLPGYP